MSFNGKGSITAGANTSEQKREYIQPDSTYSVNADGTATVSLNISGGATATFAIALNDAGKGFQMIELTASGGGRIDLVRGNASR